MQSRTPMQSESDNKLCGAKTRSGAPCRSRAMANGRCRMHGGTTPYGPLLPQWKDGKRSKVLPSRMLEAYHEALEDPDLISLRDALALVDTRLNDLLKRVDSGEAGVIWVRTRDALENLQGALVTGDQTTARIAMSELDNLIRKGVSDYAAWKEVGDLLDRRARLASAELARLSKLQQFVSNEQVLVLIAAIVDLVNEHVKDRNAVLSIAAGLRQYISPSRQ